ncbi:MAG TPA: hypothetical protein VFP56_05745, partial [Candidatus Limnocylindrales bacterium]|nr:hypothetical protein [Candidatus Limnocylindrales bacterium]
YSPQLGTFTQQDSVQGSAANPASMNRFLYAHANPATLIDPDGHRAYLDMGESLVAVDMQTKEPIRPKSSSLAATSSRSDSKVACTVDTLQCSHDDFDAMTVDQRSAWVSGLTAQYGTAGNFNGWFNNILGILAFAKNHDFMRRGSWESWVDAAILASITEGLGGQLRKAPATTEAGKAWQAFFKSRANREADSESKRLWGTAEQIGTDFGVYLAKSMADEIADPRLKTVLIEYGNAYRAAIKDEKVARSLGRELGWRLGAMAGVSGGAAAGSVCGILLIVCAPIMAAGGGVSGGVGGWLLGPNLAVGGGIVGEYGFIDPRSQVGAFTLTSLLYDEPGFITPR